MSIIPLQLCYSVSKAAVQSFVFHLQDDSSHSNALYPWAARSHHQFPIRHRRLTGTVYVFVWYNMGIEDRGKGKDGVKQKGKIERQC